MNEATKKREGTALDILRRIVSVYGLIGEQDGAEGTLRTCFRNFAEQAQGCLEMSTPPVPVEEPVDLSRERGLLRRIEAQLRECIGKGCFRTDPAHPDGCSGFANQPFTLFIDEIATLLATPSDKAKEPEPAVETPEALVAEDPARIPIPDRLCGSSGTPGPGSSAAGASGPSPGPTRAR